ncbi:hypothetical protein AUC60_25615 [Pseudomonas caspiana]|jgi:hypothetical protein|uniref:Uncharacterized protein n=1 Tax=Pseudomonas caspiana TaxID=1451454 RepID=A0A1Y3NTQ4_9PSED|nr:hypothetical protein AUC60_25615 [Pseudomonas caspiana]
MKKLGMLLLATGVLPQLSILLWVYPFPNPICQNSVNNSYTRQVRARLRQLLDHAANEIKTQLNMQDSVWLATLEDGSNTQDAETTDTFQPPAEQ